MRGEVGAQDVRQHQRIARVAVGPADRVAVSISSNGQRVDREQLVAHRAQRCREQLLRGFDRNRKWLIARLAMHGQQFEQFTEPGVDGN
jgi:hypothetical protein